MRGDTATLAIESRRNLANHILRGHTITPETPVTLAATVSNKKPELRPSWISCSWCQVDS